MAIPDLDDFMSLGPIDFMDDEDWHDANVTDLILNDEDLSEIKDTFQFIREGYHKGLTIADCLEDGDTLDFYESGLRFPEKNPLMTSTLSAVKLLCDYDQSSFFPSSSVASEAEKYVMVNPRDLTETRPLHPLSWEMPQLPLLIEPQQEEDVKPYHPSQDHDYPKAMDENEDEVKPETEDIVDVWEIENFSDESSNSVMNCKPQTINSIPPIKEPRRTSTRAAELKRRDQARTISKAVHAVLHKGKPRGVQQCRRNNRPKNSVETSPSQSDVDDWYSQPVKPKSTKSTSTKKKTSKGRIDHSISERHRRDVMRNHFGELQSVIPIEFFRDGKSSSGQISKQRILSCAKAYILALRDAKSSYKVLFNENRLLREQWQRRIAPKLLKFVKRQK